MNKNQQIFTCTNSARSAHNNLFTYSPINLFTSNAAFTMAEILISLTIIGIIAAITLPSLTANINEKTWASQRKALYSRMTQALSMLPSLNGYGATGTQDEINQKAAQAFISDGLSTVLQINNICDSTKLKDCGLPDIGFITALYPTDSEIVAPMPLEKNAANGSVVAQTAAAATCRAQDQGSRLPSKNELTALFYNRELIGISSGNFWSGSVVSSSTAWNLGFNTGYRAEYDRSNSHYVRCVKR